MMITVKMPTWQKVLGWIMIAVHLVFIGPIVIQICDAMDMTPNNVELNIIAFILAFLMAGGIFFTFLKRNMKSFGRSIKKSFLAVLAGGAVLMILNLAVNTAIDLLFPEFYNANDASLNEMSSISQGYYILMLICTAFLVPVTEECLYRGMMFQTFYHHNRIFAYILSSIVFSAIHLIGYIGDADALYLIVAFHQYLPAGIAFGLAYEMSDSIWAPIILHSINNFIAMAL